MENIHGRFKPVTTFGILFFHAVAGYAVYRMFRTGYSTAAWTLLILMHSLRTMGTTVGYHRFLTHEAFRCTPVFARAILGLGGVQIQGGTDWERNHRQHHAHADAQGDPHRPSEYGGGWRGFLWAHMFWTFFESWPPLGYFEPAPSPEKAQLLNWQKRWYRWFAIGGLALPLLAGWDGLLLGCFGVVLAWHTAWSVNSICHVIGSHATDASGNILESRRARNFPLRCFLNTLALLSGGEFWHAEHHNEQRSARLGRKWWQLDPGWWVIFFAEKMGWVWDVRRPGQKSAGIAV